MGSPVVHEIDLQPLELFQVREALRCIVHTIVFNRALGLVRPRDVESELFESICYVKCGDTAIEKKVEDKIEYLCTVVERSPSFSAASRPALSASSSAGATPDAALTKAQLSLSFFERRQPRPSAGATGAAGAAVSSVTSWFGVAAGAGTSANGSTGAAGAPAVSRTGSFPSMPSLSGDGAHRGPCWEQWHIHLSVLPPRGTPSQQGASQRGPPLVGRSSSITSSGSGSRSSIGTAAVESAQESAERVQRSARLEAELREVMLTVLLLANQNRERIPPVLTTDVVPFPFDIAVPSLSESSFGMDILKRMLQATPPPLLS